MSNMTGGRGQTEAARVVVRSLHATEEAQMGAGKRRET